MLAIALALGSCIAVGTTDFIAGLRSRQVGVLAVLAISQPAGLLLLAIAIVAVGMPPLDAGFVFYAFLAGIALLAAQLAFWQGLAIGMMGIVAPIAQAGAIIPIAVGLSQGERPTAIQLAGVLLVVIGTIVITYEPGSLARPFKEAPAGLGLALAAAVGIGAWYLTIDAAAERGTALSAAFANRVFSVALLLVPLLALRQRVSLGLNDLPSLAVVGFLEVVGIYLFAAAVSLGLLSLTGGIAALYPVPTLLLARFLLRERLHPRQRIGTVIVVVGIFAVTAGVAV